MNTQRPVRPSPVGGRASTARRTTSLSLMPLLLRVLSLLLSFTLALSALMPSPSHARPPEASLVPAGEPVPLYVVEDPHGCSLQLNPAVIADDAARQRLQRATSEANARVRARLTSSTDVGDDSGKASGNVSGAASGKALAQVAGPPVLRYDSAGNVLLRIGFLMTPKVLASYGLARLQLDSQNAVVEVNSHFKASGVPVVFEWAGVDPYPGVIDETVQALSALHTAATSPSKYYPGFVPGNFEALLTYRAAHQVNLAVLLAAPVASGAAGVTDRGRFGFDSSSFMVALDVARSATVTTVFSNALTHEIGHTMGLRHGVSQDLSPYGLDQTAAQVLEYRMSTNFPYAAGAVNVDATGTGVTSMMTLGWYATPTAFPRTAPVFVPRFSDPTARVTATSATGQAKTFALGFVDTEDSVRALKLDLLSFATASTPLLSAWLVSVVEYYHAGLNQYFMTAKPDQVRLLDQLGVAKSGWARTGEQFTAISAWGDHHPLSPTELWFEPFPVVRFYGDPSGPNTHFFTALTMFRSGWSTDPVTHKTVDSFSDELELRKLEIANAGNPHVLHFEGLDFRVSALGENNGTPTQAGTFTCTEPNFSQWHPNEKAWSPVFRLFNGQDGTKRRADGSRIDGNHRYTTRQTIVDAMVREGWRYEGIAWCERTFEKLIK